MQEIEAAVADRQMIHLSSAAGARPNGGQFTVTPECAVEQNNVRFCRRFRNSSVSSLTAGATNANRSRRVVPKLERDALRQFNRAKPDGAVQR